MLTIPDRYFRFSRSEMSLREKFMQINWLFIFFITLVGMIGFLTLYSAGNGKFNVWALHQVVRFMVGMMVMIVVALIDIRFWIRWAYPLYATALILLIIVQVHGSVGMGAQRWIDFGFFQLQPSEIMKTILILALSRYFHTISFLETGNPLRLIFPLLMVIIPVGLVMKQPDLGTAMMLLLASGAVFFLAGVRIWKFVVLLAGSLVGVPVAWRFMREYQKQRILTFINPESDPLGSGYHILQSKIALGSGGFFGKGFMAGTQGHLNFLPEKQTDFIFTMLAEEWGFFGGSVLLLLYGILILYGYSMSLHSRSKFGRLVGVGLTTTFFLYAFINIAMVMGLFPVVGVPLPLISYGGTSMLTLLFSFGLIMNAHIHRDIILSRRGASDM